MHSIYKWISLDEMTQSFSRIYFYKDKKQKLPEQWAIAFDFVTQTYFKQKQKLQELKCMKKK